MSFRIGQKVVCVDAKRQGMDSFITRAIRWVFERDWPSEGSIYTVARIHLDIHGLGSGIELFEIRNTWLLKGAYRLTRFRPLVERETDIGFAHEILRKATKRIPALSVTSKE